MPAFKKKCPALTPREAEVAQLLMKGRSSKEIARSLGISDLTVRKHRENLLRKLGLRHTAELLAWAALPVNTTTEPWRPG